MTLPGQQGKAHSFNRDLIGGIDYLGRSPFVVAKYSPQMVFADGEMLLHLLGVF